MSNVSDEHQEVVFSEGNRKEEAVEFPKDTISRVYVDFNRVFLQVWEEEVWFFPWCCTSYRTYQGCDYVWDIITCSKLDFIGCSVIVSVCESVVGVNDSSVCMGVCDKQTHFHRSKKASGIFAVYWRILWVCPKIFTYVNPSIWDIYEQRERIGYHAVGCACACVREFDLVCVFCLFHASKSD